MKARLHSPVALLSHGRGSLCAILVLAFALRLGTALYLGLNAPPDRAACGADTVEFDRMAWSAAQGNAMSIYPGGEPTAFRAPGYPLLLAGLYRIFGHAYWTSRLTMSVLGAATCWLVCLLGRRLGLRREGALIAALIVAVLPSQFYWSAHLMSETLAAFLNVAVCLVLVPRGSPHPGPCPPSCRGGRRALPGGEGRARGAGLVAVGHGRDAVRFFLAGLLAGMAALTRAAAILFPLAVAGFLLLPLRGFSRARFRQAAALILGTALVIAPWTLRNMHAFDRFALIATNGGSTFWGANNEVVSVPGEHWGGWITTNVHAERKAREVLPLGNEVDRDRREWSIGLEFFRRNPGKVPVLLAGKLFRLLRPFPDSRNQIYRLGVGAGWLFLLATWIFGNVLVARDRPFSRRAAPVYAQILVLLATTLLFYGSERFRMPYEPLLAVIAAATVSRLLAADSPLHGCRNAHVFCSRRGRGGETLTPAPARPPAEGAGGLSQGEREERLAQARAK